MVVNCFVIYIILLMKFDKPKASMNCEWAFINNSYYIFMNFNDSIKDNSFSPSQKP